jgi:RNA polymerase sigma-70 factor (family 1)
LIYPFIYSDEELVARFTTGDDAAFELLYRKFYFSIYQYAKRWLCDGADAEDITADTFIKLLKRREQFVSLDNISAFLKLTARNACFDFLKHARIKTEKQETLLEELIVSATTDFAWVEIREEFLRLVYAEVEKMPQKMKAVFLLAYKEGLKPAEIAELLDLNVQTVSNHKTNAVKLLKTAFSGKILLLALVGLLEKG